MPSRKLSGPSPVRPAYSRKRYSFQPQLEALERRLVPAAYTVTSTADTNSGNAAAHTGDLRFCLSQADVTSVAFDSGVFATHQTITLGGTELPVITTDLTITGPATGVTVSGNNRSRVFEIEGGANVTLANLSVTQGGVTTHGGGILDGSSGVLNLNNVVLAGNTALVGGGLYGGGGSIALLNSTISGNAAVDAGGLNNFFGRVSLTNSTVSGNLAETQGGGFVNQGGSMRLVNTTLNGNSSPTGGGFLSINGDVTLLSDTLAGNTAVMGGAINALSASISLDNTIVAGNTAPNGGPDVFSNGSSVTATFSLVGIGDGSGIGGGTGDLIGSGANPLNPLLAPLGNYGGPTQTLALLPGSPAIDTGTSGTGVPAADQRGIGRFGPVDIGAFESQGFMLTVNAGDNQTSAPGAALPVRFAVQVVANNPAEPVQGGAVTFTAPATGPGGAFPGAALTATASVEANGVATAPPFTANNFFGAFTVGAAARGGNSVLFHETIGSVSVVGGNLLVNGTNGNDTIIVTYAGGSFNVYLNGVSIPASGQPSPFTVGTGPGQVSPAGRVIINGYDGNDLITMNGTFAAEIHAGNGRDVIHGGDGGIVLYGGNSPAAKLTAYAGAGNDVLIGGAGTATLYGGRGHSILIGGTVTGYNYAMLTALAAKWAAGTVTVTEETSLKAAVAVGVADALYAGSGGTWGLATAASTFSGFLIGRDKKSLL